MCAVGIGVIGLGAHAHGVKVEFARKERSAQAHGEGVPADVVEAREGTAVGEPGERHDHVAALEPGAECVELDGVEFHVAAEQQTKRILLIARGAGLVHPVGHEDEVRDAAVPGEGSGGVAVGRGRAFNNVVALRVGVERILEVALDAGEGRRVVLNHVGAREAVEWHHVHGTCKIAPAGAERVDARAGDVEG